MTKTSFLREVRVKHYEEKGSLFLGIGDGMYCTYHTGNRDGDRNELEAINVIFR
jgi:hypothetical protein